MSVRHVVQAVFGYFLLWSSVVIAQGHPQAPSVPPNPLPYDLLLQKGRIIDARNQMDAIADVGMKDGKIVAVAPHLRSADAIKILDLSGYLVIPGIIDLHGHLYASAKDSPSYAQDISLYPDGFTLRHGITTIVDAGSSGRKNFEDFKSRIIDKSRTRVLAMVNIVGEGMRGPAFEDNLNDMDGEATGNLARKYPDLIVGIKTAHFRGPEWKPYDQAVIAGNVANIPVMIDYGAHRIERPISELFATHLRPGDIYTHMYSGLRGEQDPATGLASAAMLLARKRGIYMDVGHGNGSFLFTVANPLVRSGYIPDSISTDLHIESVNEQMKDILNVADKFLAMGEPLPLVIAQLTWNPAREIKQTQLGNFSPGSVADIAVLSIEHGDFGFMDVANTRMMGHEKLVCELTILNGKIIWDLNGISVDAWDAKVRSVDLQLTPHWTTFTLAPFTAARERFTIYPPQQEPTPK
jgi:dihydroorotase